MIMKKTFLIHSVTFFPKEALFPKNGIYCPLAPLKLFYLIRMEMPKKNLEHTKYWNIGMARIGFQRQTSPIYRPLIYRLPLHWFWVS
jgi:hypothetical protein